MISRGHARLIAGVSCALLAIALLAWFLRLLIVRNPPGGVGLSGAMMHRKSTAMQDILDGMIRGDLSRVETAAGRMNEYGNTIEWYLSSAEYQKYGEGFRGAVDDLRVAARDRDVDSAKEATLRLERSCIECHVLMNQRQR
jgi:hypothetical protein